MREPDRRFLALGAVLVVALFAAWLSRAARGDPPAADARTASVPLALDGDRLIALVGVDSARDLRFIVDTGAQRTAVSEVTARRLGLETVGRTRLLGPAGERDVPVVGLDPLRIGGLAVRRLPVLVVGSDALDGADGILGLDVLGLYDVRIDPGAGRLALLPPLATGRGLPLRELRVGVVAIDVEIDGTHAMAILDSGLPRTLLNRAAAAAAGLADDARDGSRRGLDGTAFATTGATVRALRAGTVLLLENAPVDVADAPLFASAGLAHRPALLLGADAFAACAIRIAWSARRLLLCTQD